MDKFLILLIAAGLGVGACSPSQKESQVANTTDVQQAIAALRAAYAAFNRGDIDAAVEAIDPQIDWTEPAEFPGGGAYHGRDGVKQYLTHSRAAWADVNSEPERFITAGDRVVVFVHARVRPRGSQEWQEVRLADVYTFRNGKAVAMRAFADRQEALRWVGIESANR
jgi:uncharacterized protein